MSSLQQQTDKKFLLFEDQIVEQIGKEKSSKLHLRNEYWFWSDRLILIENKHDDEFWDFIAFDLLMNEPRPIRFRKTDNKFGYIDFVSLNNEFGFIVEQGLGIYHVNLVKFDWDKNKLKLIEDFGKQTEWLKILVDKMDSSKFVLQWKNNDWAYNHQACKLVNGKVEFGEIFQLNKSFEIYSKNRLIFMNINISENTIIIIYDLALKKEEKFEIDRSPLPQNVHIMRRVYEWINDRMYISVKFLNTQTRGIAWIDLETKQWKLVDFETNVKIRELKYFNGNLIVNTKSVCNLDLIGLHYSNEVKFFGIPMRKPNHLRQKAWLLLIQKMKNNGEENPYTAAKEFLPLNSDLREAWFKDEEKKTEK